MAITDIFPITQTGENPPQTSDVNIAEGAELIGGISSSPKSLWEAPSLEGLLQKAATQRAMPQEEEPFGKTLSLDRAALMEKETEGTPVQFQMMAGKYFAQLPLVTGKYSSELPIAAMLAEDEPKVPAQRQLDRIFKSQEVPKAWSPYVENLGQYVTENVIGVFDEIGSRRGKDTYRVITTPNPANKGEMEDYSTYWGNVNTAKMLGSVTLDLQKAKDRVATMASKPGTELDSETLATMRYIESELPNQDIPIDEKIQKLGMAYGKLNANLSVYSAIDEAIGTDSVPVQDIITAAYIALPEGKKQSLGANTFAISEALMASDNPQLQGWLQGFSETVAQQYPQLKKDLPEEERIKQIKKATLMRNPPREKIKYVGIPFQKESAYQRAAGATAAKYTFGADYKSVVIYPGKFEDGQPSKPQVLLLETTGATMPIMTFRDWEGKIISAIPHEVAPRKDGEKWIMVSKMNKTPESFGLPANVEDLFIDEESGTISKEDEKTLEDLKKTKADAVRRYVLAKKQFLVDFQNTPDEQKERFWIPLSNYNKERFKEKTFHDLNKEWEAKFGKDVSPKTPEKTIAEPTKKPKPY